jgi:hypothetical protein
MRTAKAAVIFLSLAVMILFTAHSALAGCEVAALDALITSDNAPGTKLEGPITVYFEGTTTGIGPAQMYWFMRLRHGSQFYSFAGGPETVDLPNDYIARVPEVMQDFFEDVVVPTLYPGCDTAEPPDCPNVVLKSYDMDVDWEAPGFDSGLFYFIANIVVAVQD